MKTGLIVDLGLVEYGAAWEMQRRIVAARKAGTVPDVLLLCEHPHVITLGRNGKLANLRASDHVLRQMGVTFVETDRGGDITYHGPGQLVGYPIVNLAGEEKLAAIGVHLSRWVTSHGFAYNVSTDLRYFDLIVPCGIADKRATSLEKLLGRSVKMEEVSPRIAAHLGELLCFDLRPAERDDIESMLRAHEDQSAFAAV